MGSFAHVPVICITARELYSLTTGKTWYLADLTGEPIDSIVPDSVGGVIIIGSESHGVSEEVRTIPHLQITIPKRPGAAAESLNAAMATAVVLNQLTSRDLQ